MGLECTSWFGGTDQKVGLADKLFSAGHVGGFRADFVYLVLSTIVISLAFVVLFPNFRKSRAARISAFLCGAEVIVFVAFVCLMLVTGLLYFG